ncbi:adiponectin receptor protein [Anaeramoeba ignava]|uniref:Adiponectin receptor protein n=1 Tax=Anaeramoeba ignava TaxID=1746090 RepID=A0A9Q0LYN7_ANAIG|nr:adiponectin receptor protein [Anaeramoeba ignava]
MNLRLKNNTNNKNNKNNNKNENENENEKTKKQDLITFKEIPYWLQDNKYIEKGYRVNWNKTECLKSLTFIHNETWNIYIHFFGFILFIIILIKLVLSETFQKSTRTEKFFFVYYIFSVESCLGSSTVFHTFYCMSKNIKKKLLFIDLCGVIIIGSGSHIGPLFFIYRSFPFLQKLYLSLLALSTSFYFVMSSTDTFQGYEKRWQRFGYYLIYALLGSVPVFHGLFIFPKERYLPVFFSFFLMYLSYLIGILLYQLRLPERFFAGKLDYFGQSHHFWHSLVIIASLFQFHTLLCGYSSEFCLF